MDIKELIAQLLVKQKGQGAEMRVLLGSAAGTIENLLWQVDALKAELRDERHRHDRYVDFELAEAEELRKLKEQLRWIPVTERLPEDCFVLVYTVDKIVGEACFFDGDKFYWAGSDDYAEPIAVTHWMPLPEPPKGE